MTPSSLFQLIRVTNSILMGLAVLAGGVIAGGVDALYYNAIVMGLGFLTGFFLTGASMVLNDIHDLDIDRINMPHRPLPSGRVSLREAWLVFSVFSAVGLTISYVISSLSFLIALSSWSLSSLYNVRLKRTGLLGNVIVSYVVSVPLIYGSVIINMPSPKILVFYLMVFLSCLGREIVKGIADVEGDRAMNVMTLAVRKGPRFASVTASALILAAVLLSPLPYVLGWAGVYYLSSVVIADALFIYSVLLIVRTHSKTVAMKGKKFMLIAMGVGLIAFLLSNL